MPKKICTKCKLEKELVEFCKRKTAKDGLNGWCKSCVSLSHKIYHITHEELIKLNHHTNFQPLCSHINRDIKKALT